MTHTGWLWRTWMLVAMLCWGIAPASGQEAFMPDSVGGRTLIGPHLQYLKGFGNDTLTATLANPDASWAPVKRNSVVFGYTSTPYWFRTVISLPSSPPGRWFLELDWPRIDAVDMYFLDDTGKILQTYLTGHSLPFSARPVNHRNFVFPLPEHAGGAITVMFRVHTDSLLYFTPSLWNEIEASNGRLHHLLTPAGQTFWQAFFLGLMLAMTVYNAFIYRVTRDNAYLAYVVYCVSFVLYQCTLNGFGHKYLWSRWPAFDSHSYMLFSFLSYASATIFVSRFLRLRENGYRKLDIIAQVLTGLWLLSILLSMVFGESVVITVTSPLAILSCVLGIGVPLYVWYRKDIFGLYFLLAWSWMLLGTASWVLLISGVLDANEFTLLGGQQLGAAIETILISLALSHRMKSTKENTLSSQERLLSYVQKYSAVLDEKMSSRLTQIEDARRKFQETQSQLVERDKMVSLEVLTNGIHGELSGPRERLVADLNVIRVKTMELAHFIGDLMAKEHDQEIEDAFRDAMDDLIRPMEMMSSGHFRIAVLLQQMRATHDFAKGEKVVVRLRELLSNAAARVAVHYPQVTISLTGMMDVEIAGWPAGLEEAFLQIVKNAFQAASARKFSEELPGGHAEVSVSIALDQGHVFIVIADNGGGIAPSVVGRIFDPFFTTRTVGEGSGLGLTMARDLIARHDGVLECMSTGSSGTRMLVRFPL